MNKLLVLGNLFLLLETLVSSEDNIENTGGGFCFKQLPKKSVPGLCSTHEDCNELLDSLSFRCGAEGECVSKANVSNDNCHRACQSSPCGKLCRRIYGETSTDSKYCIKSRDHEIGSILPTEPKQFFCTCLE